MNSDDEEFDWQPHDDPRHREILLKRDIENLGSQQELLLPLPQSALPLALPRASKVHRLRLERRPQSGGPRQNLPTTLIASGGSDDSDSSRWKQETRDRDSDWLDLQEGENWLRLFSGIDGNNKNNNYSSILDDTQDVLSSAQDDDDDDGYDDTQQHVNNDPRVYPSILSLVSIGGTVPVVSKECYLCLDVDGDRLAIKDMRAPSNYEIEDSACGIYRILDDTSTTATQSWQLLPRRQLRILRPGDRLCTNFQPPSSPLLPRDPDELQQEDPPLVVAGTSATKKLLGLVLEYQYMAYPLPTTDPNNFNKKSTALKAGNDDDDYFYRKDTTTTTTSTSLVGQLLTQPMQKDNTSSSEGGSTSTNMMHHDDEEDEKKTEQMPLMVTVATVSSALAPAVASSLCMDDDDDQPLISQPDQHNSDDEDHANSDQDDDARAGDSGGPALEMKNESMSQPDQHNSDDGDYANSDQDDYDDDEKTLEMTQPPASAVEITIKNNETNTSACDSGGPALEIKNQIMSQPDQHNSDDEDHADSDQDDDDDDEKTLEMTQPSASVMEITIKNNQTNTSIPITCTGGAQVIRENTHGANELHNDDDDKPTPNGAVTGKAVEGQDILLERPLADADETTDGLIGEKLLADIGSAPPPIMMLRTQEDDQNDVRDDKISMPPSQDISPSMMRETGEQFITPVVNEWPEATIPSERANIDNGTEATGLIQVSMEGKCQSPRESTESSETKTFLGNEKGSAPQPMMLVDTQKDQTTGDTLYKDASASAFTETVAMPPTQDIVMRTTGEGSRSSTRVVNEQLEAPIPSEQTKIDNVIEASKPLLVSVEHEGNAESPTRSKITRKEDHLSAFKEMAIDKARGQQRQERKNATSQDNNQKPPAIQRTRIATTSSGSSKRKPELPSPATPASKKARPSPSLAGTPRSTRKRLRISPGGISTSTKGINSGKPIRVMATGVAFSERDVKKIHEDVKKINGEMIIDEKDAASATHLIAASNEYPLKRTPKLMISICHTSNIVNLDWLAQSAAKGIALDTKAFLLLDQKEAEETYSFDMRKTLARATALREKGILLLTGFTVYICAGVAGNKKKDNLTPSKAVFRNILEGAGATVMESLPPVLANSNRTIIITSKIAEEATKQLGVKKVATAVQQGAVVKTTADIFNAIMTQQFHHS